jgi:hypothetical protein
MPTPNETLRLQGDYKIETQTGGQLVLDVSGGATGPTSGNGKVTILGNLDVRGTTSQIDSSDTSIKDTTLTLNSGEPGSLSGAVTSNNGNSGIKISRGRTNSKDNANIAAYLEWNDDAEWTGSGQRNKVKGQFEFRVGLDGSQAQYSAIKINAIRIDENSASTIGAGTAAGPRLNIFGVENRFAVISVFGTSSYENQCTDDDDIPNLAKVKQLIRTNGNVAPGIRVGKSYLTLFDAYNTPGAESEAILVLNATAGPEAIDITTNPVTDGTVAMKITETVAEFNGIRLAGNTVSPVSTSSNLVLATNNSTTSKIILTSPTYFQTSGVPTPDAGQVSFYTGEPAAGGTGLFYVSSSTGGTVTNQEVISRKKALIYALIF